MKLFQPIQGSIESKETQENLIDRGQLQVNVTSSVNAFPVKEARISISYTGIPESILEQVVTDSSGQTELIELNAPPEEWSLDENEERQPYSEYTLNIEAEGFESISVSGTEILANTKAIQNIRMKQKDQSREEEQVFVIPAHTLYGNYPPKIAEEEIKPVNETGEIVLSRVVVPEYIIVHDGSPRDSTAQNYYVKYKDYIKNVASSEIYATWPADTIRANVLAIMSFTLNRVYTEWYRNKGFDFTITSSTAFDHKWIPERNIFEPISVIVDELFADYLSRPNVRQPILTQYCDGRRVSCPNWLTQWGSKSLGEQGFSPIEILRYYYGDDMYINTAEAISGIPSSWPGYTLEQGSQGPKVRQIQEELNVIAGAYPEIPKLTEDGIYGPETEAAVRKFQSIFGLPVTGEIDYKTWYKISEIYVGVSRMQSFHKVQEQFRQETVKLMERDRRRRKKRRRNRKTTRKGFVFLVLLLVIIGVAGVLKMTKVVPGLFRESGNVLLSDSGQKIEFPELNVSEEDVADGFYYQQLSEQEKQVYREILQGVCSMEETILLHAGENDEAGKIYEYLMYDRPELFWCDGSSKMTVYKDYTEFHPSYICTPDQRESRREQIENAAQEALAGAQGCETAYEKIKYIFKYLVDTVDYDQNALDNQNIYSSLVGKKSVCAGYSRAAQYLLKQMGIECIYVVGTVKEQGAHAWNIVKCNDKYYQMDVTFGDPIFQENETGETLPHDLVNYEYLCCTDEEIFTDHQQDDFVPYPVCDSNDLEYYRINGLYYETFDENEIYEKMKAGIEQEQEMFAIRFSENAVYEVAKEKIIDNLIPQAAQFLVDFRQLEEVKYTYAVDDRKRIIMIFWYS